MSKTAGTAVTLDEAIERYGPDALRYFLLREVGFENDGNFTWERFDERYTADLADGLGNLASRSLAMLAKYRDGAVPAATEPTTLDSAGVEAARRYAAAMDRLDLRGGAEAAWGSSPPRTSTSSRPRRGAWRRPAEMQTWTSRSRRWGARFIDSRYSPAHFSRGRRAVFGSHSASRGDRTQRRGARWSRLQWEGLAPAARSHFSPSRGLSRS